MSETPPGQTHPPRPFWRPFVIIAFLLLGLGEALLAVGEAYVWQTTTRIKAPPDNTLALTALQAQLTLLEKSTTPSATGALTATLTSLSAQLTTLETEAGADHAALTGLQANNADITALQAKVTRLAALQRAALALNAGQPLGPIPGAPPALSRFADTPPPSMAALLLAFPAAARAGAAASIAGEHQTTIWSRFLARLENLITITNGDHVILGPPAAAVIEQARRDLTAGNLAGAVTALGTLSLTTQNAMADWLTPARTLLAAQNALLAMASQNP